VSVPAPTATGTEALGIRTPRAWIDASKAVIVSDPRTPPEAVIVSTCYPLRRAGEPEAAPWPLWAVGRLYPTREAIPAAHYPCPALPHPDHHGTERLELWHVRLEVPGTPLFWEAMWRPGWPTLRVTELRGASPDVPLDAIARAYREGLVPLRGLPHVGRRVRSGVESPGRFLSNLHQALAALHRKRARISMSAVAEQMAMHRETLARRLAEVGLTAGDVRGWRPGNPPLGSSESPN
jgi:hypothetical protein